MAQRFDAPVGLISHDGEAFDSVSASGAGDVGANAPTTGQGGGGRVEKKEKKEKKVDWDAFNAIMRQYALIHGTTTVFCRHTRTIMAIQAARVLHTPLEWRLWVESPNKQIVYPEDVVFDPTGRADADPGKCNLFIPGPPAPTEGGDVSQWIGLLDWLISVATDTKEEEDALRHWCLCWYAYPLQNPGAKMRSALIFHGDEGAGKNLLNDVICDIYGRYATVVGQDELDDKFNDWRSQKQFVVGDEVATAQELGSTKNRLKNLITSPTVQINPKGLPRRQEQNQMNIVFLSNELRPLKLDNTDRRYLVIWTPSAREREFYAAVGRWREAGGPALLHRYLLDYDCGDFTPYSHPPKTRARAKLIDMSRSSSEQFLLDWSEGETSYPWCPGTKAQIFAGYRGWCTSTGQRFVADLNTFTRQVLRLAESNGLPLREWRGDVRGKTMRCWIVKEKPEHLTQSEWIENCVDEWKNKTKQDGGSHDAPF